MEFSNKATKIVLTDFHSRPMRAFHLTWIAFFLCFFAWFGIAPLMPMIRKEMKLTNQQVGNLIIASVSATIIARLLIGWLCDRIGPRRTYSGLLVLGSLPVMGVGFAHDYESIFWFRLAIGAIGASFVITQYHTSVMFAPQCVGTANAVAAGWGNLGGGVTQQVMPMLTALILATGISTFWSWRLAMFLVGLVCLLTGVAYALWTTDTPEGDFKELRRAGRLSKRGAGMAEILQVVKDYRVWALFVAYGACFGIELTIDNVAAMYFFDNFGASLETAGILAGLFGLMNLFARALGGYIADRVGARHGLVGRTRWLFLTLLGEGCLLIVFAQATSLTMAVISMMSAGLFVKMSNGATYAVVPFINRKALGVVAGIVGAGGNVGAMLAGYLFRSETSWWPNALTIVGICVIASAIPVLFVRFQTTPEVSPAPAALEVDCASEPALS